MNDTTKERGCDIRELSAHSKDGNARSFAELIATIDAFWTKQTEIDAARLTDPVVANLAFEAQKAEWLRYPIKFRKSYTESLEDAAKSKAMVLSVQGREGRAQRGPDALSLLIDQIVATRPDISQSALLDAFRNQCGPHRVIDSIDDDHITFRDGCRIVDAPVKQLKHRLSRAKRKFKASHKSL